METTKWNIQVDTGGTFTDCIAKNAEGKVQYVKVLSNSSLRGTVAEQLSPLKMQVYQQWQAPDNFVAGLSLRMLHQKSTCSIIQSFDAEKSVLTFRDPLKANTFKTGQAFEIISDEEAPILACRLATDTLPGEPLPTIQLRLATTKATNALLEHNGAPTLLLITKGLGDFLDIGDQKRKRLFSFEVQKPTPVFEKVLEIPERIDAQGEILKKLNTETLPSSLKTFINQKNASIAICLMHSYKNNKHEKQLENWLEEQEAHFISCSSDMNPFIKLLPRAQTTVINAYLDPVLQTYLKSVQSALKNGRLFLMNSAAGLVSSKKFKPKDSLLSGPAGGVMGAAASGTELDKKQIISLDMGGTSTDVARYDTGFDYQFEHTVGGATIKTPALSIETVAAGGGSICSFDGQKLTVGPDSAGAHPGPACYNSGGPLTLTDVNLLLGRLQPDNFTIPISQQAADKKLNELLSDLEANEHSHNRTEILNGLLQIANERMANAINKISLRKGYNPSDYTLVAFGGAGAQHATAIANMLDISSVLVPRKAGLLSAYGLGQASVEEFAEKQMLQPLKDIQSEIPSLISDLEERAVQKLAEELQHTGSSSIVVRRRMLFMRLVGQEATLEINFDEADTPQQAFKLAYQHRYGHWIEDRAIEVESLRVVAATKTDTISKKTSSKNTRKAAPYYNAEVQFNNARKSTPVYQRIDLMPGGQIEGPAVILAPYSTTVLEPGWVANVQHNGVLLLSRQKELSSTSSEYSESINLELFTNRFTSITKEMGEIMQRTALSVNIKERLDFSCALLNSEGELIVNAPHIPVHLGALGICVRRLKENIAMGHGDVVVTNHPLYGGSHLPDVTVVTPVMDAHNKLLGYAACRAHHAEIGGTRPGSMPPNATTLAEEGVVIPPSYLIKKGDPQWDTIRQRLAGDSNPSRAVEENLADLQAAVAANQQGVRAMGQLAEKEGTKRILHYMSALKKEADKKTCTMLRSIPDISATSEEFLDDGSRLCATIEKTGGQLKIDFSGTSSVHPGNLNATPAIVQSVIMYVLRCLIEDPIPLNEGLLDPVRIILPQSLLNPGFSANPQNCPALVGGNTEVSQRLVDLLLKPFEKAACSQGTMNNVLFGNDTFGYYETIGGGTGAGPGFDGCDAIHHHMTNTASTDPEILEHRYPVRLECYEIREHSGGSGAHCGGNGITRKLTFLEPASLSVLTQHRSEKPYGLQGGEPGKIGKQCVIRKDGSHTPLDSIGGCEMKAGDRLVIHTPGGGGFGMQNST